MAENQIDKMSRWEGIAILQRNKYCDEDDPADSTGQQSDSVQIGSAVKGKPESTTPGQDGL